jgi:hypothetical protein
MVKHKIVLAQYVAVTSGKSGSVEDYHVAIAPPLSGVIPKGLKSLSEAVKTGLQVIVFSSTDGLGNAIFGNGGFLNAGWSFAQSLVQIHSNFVQDLIDNFLAFFFVFQAGHIVDSVVHHFLSLVHDIVLALELHRNPLESRKIHLAVHAAEQLGRTSH